MKGLLIKDICLMKEQKRFFILIIAISIIMSFSNDNASFVTGYMIFVLPMMAISSISYDEYNNGYPFLFTLPVSRKKYVIEKYCLGALLGVVSMILAFLLCLCLGTFKNNTSLSDTFKAIPVTFAAMAVMLSVMLPIQLKFGAEKSRIAIFIFGGIILIAGMGFSKIIEALQIDLTPVFNFLNNINAYILIAVACVFVTAIVAISLTTSILIMKKKEF